ncbi:MAG: magnesium/cobalt transporter CorA [Alphaproteobacteria bacterium]|jgi:magnesium transporter|nr:magnesium/cobalt transporter CorA [Alphaproteobacteria bacterium]
MSTVAGFAVYEHGIRATDVTLEQVTQLKWGKERFVWIGLHEPDAELLSKVQRLFGLHELAIEDARVAHQRPKIELYGNSLFVVLHTAQKTGDNPIEFGETHVFMGNGYLVTIRHGPSSAYSEVRQRCENQPHMLRKGPDFVLYSLMDFIVDNYMPIVASIKDRVEELEDDVFKKPFDSATLENIYSLKRDLMSLKRIISPLTEMINRLMRFDITLIDRDTHAYYRDVQDHVIRLLESIDSMRELLTSALEAHLLLANVQQNEVTKKLAGWAAILAVPTAICGIYGMNFRFMPEIEWEYGYFVVMTGIISICSYMFYRFRKAGWL